MLLEKKLLQQLLEQYIYKKIIRAFLRLNCVIKTLLKQILLEQKLQIWYKYDPHYNIVTNTNFTTEGTTM